MKEELRSKWYKQQGSTRMIQKWLLQQVQRVGVMITGEEMLTKSTQGWKIERGYAPIIMVAQVVRT